MTLCKTANAAVTDIKTSMAAECTVEGGGAAVDAEDTRHGGRSLSPAALCCRGGLNTTIRLGPCLVQGCTLASLCPVPRVLNKKSSENNILSWLERNYGQG